MRKKTIETVHMTGRVFGYSLHEGRNYIGRIMRVSVEQRREIEGLREIANVGSSGLGKHIESFFIKGTEEVQLIPDNLDTLFLF